jgi:outer membrane biosynthesis protein TonB
MAMAERAPALFYRTAAALALVLLVAGCTKGGQFDPTEMFNSDVFDSKQKLKGDRVPVFPDGVPGATTGVPQDLVKGYQPPPDQPTDADAAVPGPAPPPDAEAQKPKPKPTPTPKPKLAAQKPAASPPTRISVGPKPATAQQQPAASQSPWPSPQANSGQPAAQPSQSVWPAPTQQAAQPSQSIWPNPQPPPTKTQ